MLSEIPEDKKEILKVLLSSHGLHFILDSLKDIIREERVRAGIYNLEYTHLDNQEILLDVCLNLLESFKKS